MISKQFLVTAIVMGIVAVMLSVFFRLQLGWPGESFAILETFLGKWAPGGVLGSSWGVLGRSWGLLGPLWRVLGGF